MVNTVVTICIYYFHVTQVILQYLHNSEKYKTKCLFNYPNKLLLIYYIQHYIMVPI